MKAWYTGSSLLLLAVPAAAPGPTPFLGLPLLLRRLAADLWFEVFINVLA
jgi:hypothetical protein